jgi:hypothetical protein
MNRSSAIWLGAALVIAAGAAWTVNRVFVSCVWAARDISHLSLRGSVRTLSCDRDLWDASKIVLRLDSGGFVRTSEEARRLGFKRTDSLTANDAGSPLLAPYIGKAGWYMSTVGQNSNGGFTIVVLDSASRTLQVTHHPN